MADPITPALPPATIVSLEPWARDMVRRRRGNPGTCNLASLAHGSRDTINLVSLPKSNPDNISLGLPKSSLDNANPGRRPKSSLDNIIPARFKSSLRNPVPLPQSNRPRGEERLNLTDLGKNPVWPGK